MKLFTPLKPNPSRNTETPKEAVVDVVLKDNPVPSTRPWKAIRRVMGSRVRIDVMDALGNLIFHFHDTGAGPETTENWENDVSFILNKINKGDL